MMDVPRFAAVIERDPESGGWRIRIYNAAYRLAVEMSTDDEEQAGRLAIERIRQLEASCIVV